MIICNKCNASNEAANSFCGNCGNRLEKSQAVPEVIGERRQLTVMFCDLVGSTSLAEQLDPEEWLAILRSYQQACESAASQYGGVIAKYIGDGVLIYFGHPNAHEDDPRRSILSGLGIKREIASLSKVLKAEYGVELRVRIGIHTGLVVVGQVGAGAVREENAIVGEAPNIAARLQSFAQANQLMISEATHRLVPEQFSFEEFGQQQLKGISQSLKVFRVISEKDFASSFVARAKRGLTPLVGRAQELNKLHEAWQSASIGHGKTVFIEGEPGIGKSRLLDAFKNNLVEMGHVRLPQEYYCSAFHINSAFYPIIATTSNAIRALIVDDGLDPYHQVKRYITDVKFPEEHTPVFAASMSIDLPKGVVNPYTPDESKEIIRSDWIEFIRRLSKKSPILLILEDVHWIDPSTSELVTEVNSMIADMSVLFIITSRPGGFQSLDIDRASHHIELQKLGEHNNREIVESISGNFELPAQLVQHIVDRADGVPLFVEELTKAVMESGAFDDGSADAAHFKTAESFAIPTSLQDSLMSRLDKLSSIKEVVQVAAAIGRRFSAHLLQDVLAYDDDLLTSALDRLVDAELIHLLPDLADNTYEFKHALLQDAAYQSLLKSTRRQHHHEIAIKLQGNDRSSWQASPEILAHHYTEARDNDKAVSYWLQAGIKAAETSSHLEAVAHLEKSLELIQFLPENAERDKREIEIQTYYIGPLMTARGYTSRESEAAVNRAVELSKKVEECPQMFPILGTRYHFLQAAGHVRRAAEVGEEFMTLAEKHNDDGLMIVGYRLQGASRFLTGDASSSMSYWAQISNLYDRERHHPLAFIYGQDINVLSMSYRSLALWNLGKEEEAIRSAQEALDAAELLNHPNSTCVALYWSAITFTLLDQPEKVIELCDRLIKICESLNIPLWLSVGKVLLGWAYCKTGKSALGFKSMEHGFTAYNAMKIGLFRPLLNIAKAQALLENDRAEQAIIPLQESIKDQQESGERWLSSLSHCTLADVILDADPSKQEAANSLWRIALAHAKSQNAVPQLDLAESRLNIKLASNYSMR